MEGGGRRVDEGSVEDVVKGLAPCRRRGRWAGWPLGGLVGTWRGRRLRPVARKVGKMFTGRRGVGRAGWSAVFAPGDVASPERISEGWVEDSEVVRVGNVKVSS